MPVTLYPFTSSISRTPMLARLIGHGDPYGKDFALRYEGHDKAVEFYDRRFPHTPLGQFIARYGAGTLLARDELSPLALDGGIDAWTIGHVDLRDVLRELGLRPGPSTESRLRQERNLLLSCVETAVEYINRGAGDVVESMLRNVLTERRELATELLRQQREGA